MFLLITCCTASEEITTKNDRRLLTFVMFIYLQEIFPRLHIIMFSFLVSCLIALHNLIQWLCKYMAAFIAYNYDIFVCYTCKNKIIAIYLRLVIFLIKMVLVFSKQSSRAIFTEYFSVLCWFTSISFHLNLFVV